MSITGRMYGDSAGKRVSTSECSRLSKITMKKTRICSFHISFATWSWFLYWFRIHCITTKMRTQTQSNKRVSKGEYIFSLKLV